MKLNEQFSNELVYPPGWQESFNHRKKSSDVNPPKWSGFGRIFYQDGHYAYIKNELKPTD